MSCVPLKKYIIQLIIQSAHHISIYAQSACHISKYAQSYGGGVFFEGKFFYEDANQTKNFTGAKTENSLYYRDEKHY